jgi:tetratricopeptide (TPR) repeat protein
VNLGNIAFAAGNHEEARGHYERALEVAPENPAALLGATRAANELEDIEGATTRYERLASVSPDLAERFSHLGPGEGSGTARAAEAATNPAAMMIWEDEE